MKGFRFCLFSALVLLAFVLTAPFALAANPFKLKVCAQSEHAGYLLADAFENGKDKAVGLDVEIVYFDSGMAQMEGLPAKQWVVGSTGSVPMLAGALRYGAYMIGIANDDSTANAVLVRPDSPILQHKGVNPAFPETFGSADSVRGKTILVTTVSSGHYALSTWLKRLGLKDSDVVIKNMDQGQILAAYESGIGDVAVLWIPSMFVGQSKGWKIANKDSQTGAKQLNVIIAEKKFADEHPEQVAAFLKGFMGGVDKMKKDNVALAPEFAKFLMDTSGVDMPVKDAASAIKENTVFSMQEQLAFFDKSKGPSDVEQWMAGMADFFVEQGKFSREEMDRTLKSGFITDKFLKMAAEMK